MNEKFTDFIYQELPEGGIEILGLRDSSLMSVNIPEGVIAIGNGAFRECDRLTRIYIPDSVRHIKEDAFLGCRCLDNVIYGGDKESWCAVRIESGNNVFSTIFMTFEGEPLDKGDSEFAEELSVLIDTAEESSEPEPFSKGLALTKKLKLVGLSVVLAVLAVAVMGLLFLVRKDNLDDTDPKGEGVMTHAEYVAAEAGTVVTIEAYVQATQEWWNDKITVYLQDRDGGYIAYDLPCSKSDAAKLTVGTKLRITGEKAIYRGLHEIYDATATFEIIPGNTYVATAFDATSILDNEAELIKHRMELAAFKGLTVVSVAYKNAETAAEANDDIYVTVKLADGGEHSFCVEVYLTGTSTEVYRTALALEAGDVIDVEGFLYWYDGVNTHITECTIVSKNDANDADLKGEGVMTHAEYVAAEAGTVVTIEAYVQAKQGWWDNKITVYLQDRDGGYIAYDLPCSESDAAKLTVGTKIRITGEKAIYKGLHEIYDAAATFEIIPGNTYVATAFDATSILDNEAELIKHRMELAAFKGLTVVSVAYKNAETAAEANDDIYVTVKLADGEEHSFCVEVYLTGTSTEVYRTALTLEAGDVIDVEGFLYWYGGVNTHITAITVK